MIRQHRATRLIMFLVLIPAVLLESVAAMSPLPWTRTSSDDLVSLSIVPNGSYSLRFAATPDAVILRGPPPAGVDAALASASQGDDDALGRYDELRLPTSGQGSFAVRYYSSSDAFVFQRQPTPLMTMGKSSDGGAAAGPPSPPSTFPNFHFNLESLNATVRCIGWSNRFFFPGGVTKEQGSEIERCGTDGPMLFVDGVEPSAAGAGRAHAALAISALDHFSSNSLKFGVSDQQKPYVDVERQSTPADRSGIPPIPCNPAVWGDECALGVVTSPRAATWNTSAVVLARPGVGRAARALGTVLRRAHNTTRRRAVMTQQLSAWNDNQAGYSWWSVGNNQSVWGQPELIYRTLKKGYDEAKIPIRSWEPDNALSAVYSDHSGWIYEDFGKWNLSLYPSAGNLSSLLGVPLVLYMNGWSKTSPHTTNSSWKFKQYSKNCGGQVEIEPASSLSFHSSIFQTALKWGFKGLFTDFIGFRGGWASRQGDGVAADDEPEHAWLGGMTLAAQNLGVEVQYCMANAHQLLMSLEWPAVTNARANGDGGLDTGAFRYTSLYAAMLGLGWSKDNLRTADRCYVPAMAANGSVLFSCDASNYGQFVNGHFSNQVQQTALAALSMGPVGIADQLSAPPTDPSARITTNVTLAMATCASNGMLLQPSYPATPLDAVLVGHAHLDVYATHTAVAFAPDGPSVPNTTAYFFTAIAFATAWKHNPVDVNYTLHVAELASMVDSTMSVPGFEPSAFEDPLSRVPHEAFLGARGASGTQHKLGLVSH